MTTTHNKDDLSGIVTSLTVHVCENASDAIRRGFFYRPPIYLPIQINSVVVVKNGTALGKDTVDLIMEDAKGQKYACMLTSALLKSIP